MAPAAQEEPSSSEARPVVVLTGYGLFRDYASNSSKEVVEKIAETGINGIDLRTEILPVSYAAVKKRTQELFERCKPCVTIHCGMFSDAEAVILEKVARNSGYDDADVNGERLCGRCCFEKSDEFLTSCLDLEKIVADCKRFPKTTPVYISRDAGLYLCEYIYYLALNRCQKSLFIHLPVISESHPLEDLVETVRRIIVLAVQQCRQDASVSEPSS